MKELGASLNLKPNLNFFSPLDFSRVELQNVFKHEKQWDNVRRTKTQKRELNF